MDIDVNEDPKEDPGEDEVNSYENDIGLDDWGSADRL